MSKRSLLVLLVIAQFVFSTMAMAQLSYEGSSSIGNALLPELAKAFTAKTGIPFGKINPTNSAQGFQAVKDGKATIGGLSRLLAEEELQAGLGNRVIGYDAVVVYVNIANQVSSLTTEQLKGIFLGKTTNWKDVGGQDLPIITLVKLGGEDGGVVGQFRELVMGGAAIASPGLAFPSHQEDIEYVASNPAAITFAALAGDTRLAKPVAIDGISPSNKSVGFGDYSLARPYLLIFKDSPSNTEVTKFMDFVFSQEGQEIVRKFVVPVLSFDKTGN